MGHINYIHILIIAGVIAVVAAVARFTSAMIVPPPAPESTAFKQYRDVVQKFLRIGFAIPVTAYVLSFGAGFVETNRLNDGGSADGWTAAREVLGVVGTLGLVVFPLIALIASEKVVRRSSVPVATLVARSTTTLVVVPLLIVAAIVAVLAVATTVGALLIDYASADFHFKRQLGLDWLSLALLVITAALATVTVRLAISRGDLDAADASDNWTRSGVATRAVALFTAGASMAWLFALGAFSNVGWGYRSAVASARQGWEWVESAHVQGATHLFQAVAMLLIVIALVACAKPPVKIPRAALSAPTS